MILSNKKIFFKLKNTFYYILFFFFLVFIVFIYSISYMLNVLTYILGRYLYNSRSIAKKNVTFTISHQH